MTQQDRIRERDISILKTYFKLLDDLGKEACQMSKADLYAQVADKVFLSDKYTAKIIRRTMCDREAVAAANQ